MTVQFFPSGFPEGVVIRGIPLLQAYSGKTLWVGNNATRLAGESLAIDSITSQGAGDFNQPFATIDFAIGQAAASRGDIIIVRSGHVETVVAAAGLALDVANIAFVGLGAGSARPTINFTTVVGASMAVTAANCSMSNFLFTGGIDALTNPIHVQAADFTLMNCETKDVTGQATDFIVTTAAADRMMISDWVHRGAAAAGADTALSIVGGDGAIVRDFWIDGNFAVACIENVTTAATNLTVGGGRNHNYARTRNAADIIFTAAAATTGNVGPNISARLQDNAANITEAFAGVAMQFFQRITIVNADGESSIDTNITASTDA